MTNPDKVERLRELLGKATEGPWDNQGGLIRAVVSDDLCCPLFQSRTPAELGRGRSYDERFANAWSQEWANAALIVEAINALPALLAVVEAAEKSATASMKMVAALDEFEGQPEYYGETVTPAFDCARNLRTVLATLKGEG